MKNEIIKSFFNSSGKVFATLTNDGILVKSEHEKDRLRIYGNRAHAIDSDVVQEALRLQGRTLLIREKTTDGKVRKWSVPLKNLEKAPRRQLRGVERIVIELGKCELVSGQPESWYLSERNKSKERLVAPKSEQMVLFAPRNELFCRLKYEMGANA